MKPDPTRTKTHIKNFENSIKQLITSFWYKTKPQIIQSIIDNKQRLGNKNTLYGQAKVHLSATDEIQRILDLEEYEEIRIKLRPIIDRYTKHGYEKGAIKGHKEIKKKGYVEFEYVNAPVDIEAVGVMVDNNFRLIDTATIDMKKHMLRIISTGMLEGESMQNMTKQLNERINIGKYNCERIVRTETIRNYNQAVINQYKKAGVKYWEWISALDERTCELCAGLDGTIHKVGEAQPPTRTHPNCRCSVGAYFKKEK